jgi:hypothetical protein
MDSGRERRMAFSNPNTTFKKKSKFGSKAGTKGSQGISRIMFVSRLLKQGSGNFKVIGERKFCGRGEYILYSALSRGWSKVWEGVSAEDRQDNDTIITHWKHTPFSHPQAHHVTRTIRAHYFRKYTSNKTRIRRVSMAVLRIRHVYPGSEFFYPGSRIRIKEIKYFYLKKLFLSSRKYDPGCSSRIRILTFYPSRIPGQKGAGSRIRNTG